MCPWTGCACCLAVDCERDGRMDVVNYVNFMRYERAVACARHEEGSCYCRGIT